MPDQRARVLVLGAGFLGSAIASRSAAGGAVVEVLTRTAPDEHRARLLRGCRVLTGDVADLAARDHLDTLVAGADHVVFALGAGSPVDSAHRPTSQVTGELVQLVEVLEALRRTARADLTYLSSGGAVYGNCGARPVAERSPTEPISSYGIVKLSGEHYARMYAADHGVRSRVLRIANAYGPAQRWAGGQGLVARLMHAAWNDEAVPVFGGGHSVRDYVHVDDVAMVVEALLPRRELFEVFNVGSGTGHSVLSLIDHINRVTGRTIALQQREARSFDVRSVVLDTSALRSAIDYRPVDIEAGLSDTWHGRAGFGLDGPELSVSHRQS